MSAINVDTNFSADVALPKSELLEIHRSKIGLYRSKAGYNYPTIRLPHKLHKLAGLPVRTYQAVHEGALAFLSSSRPHKMSQKVPNPPSSHGVNLDD